jgi:hypothetical protein
MLFGGDRGGVDDILVAVVEEAIDIDDLELGEGQYVKVVEEDIVAIES